MADHDSDSDEEVQVQQQEEEPAVPEDATLTNPDVVTKYQEAAKIAQAVLLELVGRIQPGAKIVDLCRFGDELIEQKTANIFKNKGKNGKAVMKGIAFPVCLSVNENICHVSPLETDTTVPVLVSGDLVKIDLGVHIDGFIAVVAHTVLVPSEAAAAATRTPEELARRQQVWAAAYAAAEVAVRLLKPGNTNHMVTQAIKSVAEAFDVRPIAGTLMHQMKQFVIDGNKMILLRDEPDQKIEACTFEAGEVYAIDIAMSTGDGRPRESGARTTVYKRAVEKKYSLRNKSSRAFFNEVNKRFPTLPFSVRSFEDETTAKLGVRECVTHELLAPYPILQERDARDFVAHVKVTVLLLASGSTAQITGLLPSPYLEVVRAGALAAAAESAVPAPALPESLEGLETKLSAAYPVAQTLLYAAQQAPETAARVAAALSPELIAVLQQAPLESKKKAKKKAKATAAAATAAEAK